jgi:pimeloyl-ACP methyl ester carboxylesterase
MENEAVSPFKISVAPEVLDDLQKRLESTRWTYQMEGADCDAGTDLNYLKELVSYWRNSYDWRKQEEKLNQFAHFKTGIDGTGIHFVHERGKGPNPFPLILTHGYPDSFYRFAKIIPMLTDPEAYGGSAEDAFDVVVPDLPGYGFSDKPSKNGAMFRVNDLWARLMTARRKDSST